MPTTSGDCQLPSIPEISEGLAMIPPEGFIRRLRLLIRRSMKADQVRKLKTSSSMLFERLRGVLRERPYDVVASHPGESTSLQAGDLVRVKSKEEIGATLNEWGILKGCMFMPIEMSPYCGTTQRVLKRMERFVDERDYQVKRCNGVFLLEGLNCRGTTHYGRCDRNCYFFWREEWLEKLNGGEG